MSQFPHDRFNKNLFELHLSPFGEIKTQRPMDPETTFIDIYFIPSLPIPLEPYLSLLAKCIAGQTVAFEPYRNPVEVDEIQGCVVKALQIQKENCPEPDPQAELKPRMWIITPTLAEHKLTKFGAIEARTTWGKGIYLLPQALQTGIILVHQLPVIPETLWFRLMGKDRVQENAMSEVAALPVDNRDREQTLDLLISYRMELAAKQNLEPDEQELIMQLSPLYLEKLEESRQDGEIKGRQDVVLQILDQKFGKLSAELEAQIRSLSLVQLELLVADILTLRQINDLLEWLQNN